MLNFMKYLSRSVIACGVIITMFPTFVWFQTPELTQMQILIDHWVTYLLGTSLVIIGFCIELKNNS